MKRAWCKKCGIWADDECDNSGHPFSYEDVDVSEQRLRGPRTDARGSTMPPRITRDRLVDIRLFADTMQEPLKTDLYLLIAIAEKAQRQWDEQTTS